MRLLLRLFLGAVAGIATPVAAEVQQGSVAGPQQKGKPATSLSPTFSSITFPLETLKSRCVELSGVKVGNAPDDDAADCGVSEFGTLGVLNDQTYHYAIYCLMPDYAIKEGGCKSNSPAVQYYRSRAVAVFVSKGKTKEASLLIERAESEVSLNWYDKPEFVVNSFGTFLYLPIRLDGTGAGNLSEYYLWTEPSKEWQKLDSDSWIRDIKIPAGVSRVQSIWPNLKSMTAEAYFYRSDDANCCPTGGTARIQLTIENGRFAIKSIAIDPKNMRENK